MLIDELSQAAEPVKLYADVRISTLMQRLPQTIYNPVGYSRPQRSTVSCVKPKTGQTTVSADNFHKVRTLGVRVHAAADESANCTNLLPSDSPMGVFIMISQNLGHFVMKDCNRPQKC